MQETSVGKSQLISRLQGFGLYRHTERRQCRETNRNFHTRVCTELCVRDYYRPDTEMRHRKTQKHIRRDTNRSRERKREGYCIQAETEETNLLRSTIGYVAAERRGGSMGERQGQRQHGMRYNLPKNPELSFQRGARRARERSKCFQPTVRCRRECCCGQTGSANAARTLQIGTESRRGNTALWCAEKWK